MANVPVRCEALDLWTGPGAGTDRSRFDSPWSSTLDLLDREAFHVGADEVVLAGGWQPSMIRRDGWPKAQARPSHPRVVVRLLGTTHKTPTNPSGDLVYPSGTFDRWQDNVRAVALALEALRKVDRYGVTSRGEQYRGFAALPSGSPSAPSAARGRALITRAGSVAAALRAHHPDHGGDSTDFADVQAARADGAS
jgi:hypothetical protein